ncbi:MULTISPECIES: sugar phosphate nucleotidyltransferase [unclassified Paenibacillus]|uniref:sugar phosphate nucleotidyltransferase n=1 Tax=unclassified Paenibacillus TaxID=185978 RepID=UPI002784AD52|nr:MULTISPECIES: sugar phosphate nucleotidyltransferase [unclassified Paenibacillus]MDQ0898056.1 mannose-1-phosphate guanylyltransferase [Paenibacillus sp. V4I7]MDQ0915939.1 mannose-1-phosphate guanylyltransferase [Paenibacillus sp. V4I5]
MKLVLLSGGSGKRLWPLSNDSRSKQFLRVLEDAEGRSESMVQRVWRQLQNTGLGDDAYLATNRSQVEMIISQLGGDAPLIVEPERRDTFPAIALAAAYMYDVESLPLNTVITVLPVDPYVDEAFFQKIKQLEEVLHETDANLALMGVVPTIPSEKYGYIVPSDKRREGSEALHVNHFAEKPNREQAAALIEQKALWNCGVFAFRLGYLIEVMVEKGIPIQYEEMLKNYHKLTKISFDYEIVEKEASCVVVPYDGYWKDLGTWNTLTEEMSRSQIGTGIVTEDSENTHLINELDIPVTVIGIKDAVIAVSPDGILVTSKSESPRIKEVMNKIEHRPMYEERRWGRYRVIDYVKYAEDNEVLTKRILVHAGKNISYQLHYKRSEVWTIVSGVADIVINDKLYQVKPGDVVRIPDGTRHSIRAITDVEFIEVQSGSELVEEDTVRICMAWKDIPLHQFI